MGIVDATWQRIAMHCSTKKLQHVIRCDPAIPLPKAPRKSAHPGPKEFSRKPQIVANFRLNLRRPPADLTSHHPRKGNSNELLFLLWEIVDSGRHPSNPAFGSGASRSPWILGWGTQKPLIEDKDLGPGGVGVGRGKWQLPTPTCPNANHVQRTHMKHRCNAIQRQRHSPKPRPPARPLPNLASTEQRDDSSGIDAESTHSKLPSIT